jgi:hypothetical protein
MPVNSLEAFGAMFFLLCVALPYWQMRRQSLASTFAFYARAASQTEVP